jgi:hypothetical protein
MVRFFKEETMKCERYYDRKTIQLIEQIRAKGKQRLLDVEDVGKVLRVREYDFSVSHAL